MTYNNKNKKVLRDFWLCRTDLETDSSAFRNKIGSVIYVQHVLWMHEDLAQWSVCTLLGPTFLYLFCDQIFLYESESWMFLNALTAVLKAKIVKLRLGPSARLQLMR